MKLKTIVGILTLVGICIIFFSNLIVSHANKDRLYSDVSKIPKTKVGLLLGTGKYLKSGQVNLYYKYRVDAAVELFKKGKIKFILISGDNSRKDYNEPEMFRNDLIKLGIPEDKIYLDYAGFRTLDSVVRAKEIFGQDQYTIISQKFHNERAIFISENKSINAIGFNAKDVRAKYGFKTKLREVFARTKMVLDLYLLGKQPKYLGDTIEIK